METAAGGASAGTGRSTTNQGLRIISAIASKDMREALKNKLLLSILLGTAFVVVNGAILPLLLEKRGQPNIVVYDQGRSTILRGLAGDEGFRLVLVDTQDEFEEMLTEGPGTWLGVVIPEDFDQRAGDSQVIELGGYYAHWVDAGKIDAWKVFFEEQLRLATWGVVQIDLADHALYPAVDAGGQVNINLMTQILAISTIGIALVPLLMVEEKESHTLDALLVSPARLFQVIAGKALVGLVYCMLAAAVVIFFNRHRIVHWDIVLLTSILAGVFVVAVGVLVGVLSDNPTSAAFWVGPLLILILVPLFAQLFITDSWSPLLRTLLSWMPSSILLDMYRYSFASAYPVARLWSGMAVLASLTGGIFLLAGWRMQRVYR
jgi:ABC-2 type transport system permease protein